MTYADLYNTKLQAYTNEWETFLSSVTSAPYTGTNIREVRNELLLRKTLLEKLEGRPPEAFSLNLVQELERAYAEKEKSHVLRVQAVEARRAEGKRALEASYALALSRAEKDAEHSVSDLTKKYDELLGYRDKVALATLQLNVSSSDLQVDTDSLTREEMNDLLDSSLAVCKSLGDDKVRQAICKVLEPPDECTLEDKITFAGIILITLTLFAPIAFVFLGGYMIYQVCHLHDYADKLRIADKLMYGVSFAGFRDTSATSKISEPDYAAVDAEVDEKLAKLEEINPSLEKERLQQEINQNYAVIAEVFRKASSSVYMRHSNVMSALKTSIQSLQTTIDTYLESTPAFPTACSQSFVLGKNFVLGREDGLIDVAYEVGLRNLTFAQKTPEIVQFVKLLFTNLLLAVRPKQLRCTIYDPEGLGADFATFFSKETHEYISVVTTDFNKLLESYRMCAQTNLRILDQLSIDEYNEEASSKGKVTLEYHLLLVISGEEKFESNRLLTEFMQFSARTGVLVWLITPSAIQGCLQYKKAFEGVASPYPVSPALFSKAAKTYADAFANLKDTGILYKPAFAERYLPEKSWWQENTDRGIKLNFGLQDGDPSKGYALELGDANVHGLCVGATGAGKSAFNNQLILSLVTRYPPSALEMVMIDFKNIEFATLTNLTTHISRIPHARIIAGTKDGEYAISIFDYLIAEMDRRTVLFTEVGAKKIETYNVRMRNAGTPERCLPRILLLIDEFQVMFTEVDPKSVDVIKGRVRALAKLARFCGCHMFFTSQSMKGTMDKDILDQFSLRVALRCSSDTSNEIIGSTIASKVKQKFGYLYTNTSAGETQDTTLLWRTPFASEEVIYDTLDKVEDLCKFKGEKHCQAYFYDENEKYPASQLQEWQTKHSSIVAAESRLMVLGERTGFSLNLAPINFKLKRADGENVLVYAFEELDFNSLVMTLVRNIQASPSAQLLINCADEDLFTVLDLEQWYPAEYLDVARPMLDVSEWLDILEDLIESRSADKSAEYAPLYFLALRWDKQNGIYRNENYKLQERWKYILSSGSAVDVHIVLCVQLHKDIPSGAISMFNHLICARGPEDAGYKFMGNGRLSKLPDSLGFAIYRYGTADQKFKIYQYSFGREVESREIRL